MKIISKKKDFYDYMLAYGVDETEVFVRETEEVGKVFEKNASKTLFEAFKAINFQNYSFGIERKNRDETIVFFFGLSFVFFCGEVVPAMKIVYEDLDNPKRYRHAAPFSYDTHFVEFFYNEKDFLNKCEELNIDAFSPDPSYLKEKDEKKRLIKKMKYAKKILNESSPLKVFSEWANDLKVPYYEIKINQLKSIDNEGKGIGGKYSVPLVTCPLLRDYQFARYMDGTQVFQRVEQYLFGDLKMGEKEIVEISDEDMAVAKGHGHKYSFKKMPTK